MEEYYDEWEAEYRRIRLIRIICILLSIVLVIGVAGMLYHSRLKELERQAYYESLQQQADQQAKEEEEARLELERTSSVYQKLKHGLPVNVLIVGDSIANGVGASAKEYQWTTRLMAGLNSTYRSNINVTNLSMNGSTTYAAYALAKKLSPARSYDLVIICSGQNDSRVTLSVFYESLIRTIHDRYPKCSVIAVLQSSQQDYTGRIRKIQELCEYYGIPMADTIPAFEKNYDDLVTEDGIHPNDAGQTIYADVLRNLIGELVEHATPSPVYPEKPLNADAAMFEDFAFIGKEHFERYDNIYRIAMTATGILGLDHTYRAGENAAQFYADGALLAQISMTSSSAYRRIDMISDGLHVEQYLEVRFATTEEADGFSGIMVSWPDSPEYPDPEYGKQNIQSLVPIQKSRLNLPI